MIRDADRRAQDPARPRSRTSGPALRNVGMRAGQVKIKVDGTTVVRRRGDLRAARQRRHGHSAASRSSTTPAPTTAGSTSASAPRTVLSSGRALLGRVSAGHGRPVAVRPHHPREADLDQTQRTAGLRTRRRRPTENQADQGTGRPRCDHGLRTGRLNSDQDQRQRHGRSRRCRGRDGLTGDDIDRTSAPWSSRWAVRGGREPGNCAGRSNGDCWPGATGRAAVAGRGCVVAG